MLYALKRCSKCSARALLLSIALAVQDNVPLARTMCASPGSLPLV